ncbi:hypothetical protein GW793_03405 [bacterium]|uniref:Nucleoid-associated protein, YbaB/EbfC family n=2 Tax=Katanobacteria TaxID=422282 RepID=A0A2M7X2Z6_UNCKA|nr:hypothetical protein [bacterium]PIP56943.1 MAG: hypothetical protein COX05_00405 [candidate division WWE3 bacterium CG22_combo_CG10-13_8_21_14_all_39_12]PJA40508.1 MAG: hypothetical protein CO179_02110 [candidate division WWE3 bacterium CG_4_9_14_3_um_filter_39_7]
MFDQLKQINDMRKKAKEIETQLSGEVLEVVHKGVVIQVTANQDFISLQTNGASDEIVLKAINEALKESKKVMAKRMRGQMGDLGLNLPGM